MMKTPQRELHDYISEISEGADVRAGSPLPWEPWKGEEGLISPFSAVTPAAFDSSCSIMRRRRARPVIDLDSARNRTGDVRHVWVEGIGPGQLYAYRVDGPASCSMLAPMRSISAWPCTARGSVVSGSRHVPLTAARLVCRGEKAILDDSETYCLEARSSAILLARKRESGFRGSVLRQRAAGRTSVS
jgi:hypothetical protein